MKRFFQKIKVFFQQLFDKKIEPIAQGIIAQVKQNASLQDILEKSTNLLDPPRPEIPGPGQTWENTVGNIEVKPNLCFYPASINELVKIINDAETSNHKVRAVGSGHSFSDVAATDDYLVFTHGLNRVLKNDKGFSPGLVLEQTSLKDPLLFKYLFEVESGITLHNLNEVLSKNYVALSTMGSFDAQTIIGAASTATHGTGISLGSLPSLIRSIVLVTTGGKKYRIEPTNGITDSTKYNSTEIELVQNDDWFYSVIVGMGCFGIIYSVVIDVIDSFWLREVKKFRSWDDVKTELIKGDVLKNNRHYEVEVNPYLVDGQRSCLELTQNKIGKPSEIKDHGHRNYFSALLDLIPEYPELALAYLNQFPEKTPKTINSALKSLVDTYENVSYKIMYVGLPNIKRLGFAVEFGFPVANNKYLEAVEKVFEVADHLRTQKNHYINSPVTLRFVKAGKAYLSMDYGVDTCMIDIPMLNKTKGDTDSFQAFQDALIPMGGRLHWGKINDRLNLDYIKANYPAFDKWKSIFDQLNSKGTFKSIFTERCGF